MKLVPVPVSLEESSFDDLLSGLPPAGSGGALLDARRLRWVDPYGMLGLLAIGQVASSRGERYTLQLPVSSEVLSYLARVGFFEQARDIFDLHGDSRRTWGGSVSDVLLEITPVRSHGDVHTVVDRVQERAGLILTKQLNYPRTAVVQFSVILSEVCQNIAEHAGAGGWVAAQTYHWAKRLGRKVVVIAVMDLGVGFRASLAAQHAARHPDPWNDATALQAAFLRGMTRFRDPGRGQGIQQIRKQVARFAGKISIRSGTARIADVPDWDDGSVLSDQLLEFPGAQIGIVLPAIAVEQRVEEGKRGDSDV